ncbi:hypothetical protein [Ramlibacter alkalitolerans]|uniref:Uncharacterized protein n=1 Tax=Ramlibacter alkalitolerans TaxID=2039631 RepID=A0ABS1JU58_9BURK|nr:hypothetical protein [Ramlibacter alkalitolerans]MBL0427661.1 hypothetical protein [Ramlibacter alkalitolerans]
MTSPDFAYVPDTRLVAGKSVPVLLVTFKGEAIALFSEANRQAGDVRTLRERADDYVGTYGYLAEWRRRWNNGDRCNWSEALRVD